LGATPLDRATDRNGRPGLDDPQPAHRSADARVREVLQYWLDPPAGSKEKGLVIAEGIGQRRTGIKPLNGGRPPTAIGLRRMVDWNAAAADYLAELARRPAVIHLSTEVFPQLHDDVERTAMRARARQT
jgi:hypothetical protein